MSGVERREPPTTADEATTLRAFLDRSRATLRRQVEGLDRAQLAARVEPSTMTLGGIAEHLAWVEDFWLGQVLLGRPQAARWSHLDWDADPDAEWSDAVHHDAAALDALLRDTGADSDRVLDEALARDGLDQLSRAQRHGQRVSLRWVLLHLVEEYARHCGHADLLRERVDGTTGL